MALRVSYSKKHRGVKLVSGRIYEFNYSAYENDPRPMIIFVNHIEGRHPNTNHQWRLISGINLNYVPRKYRKRFIKMWKEEIEKTNSIKVTWNKVKNISYLKGSWRRYLTKPNYYIRNIREIPPDQWEAEVVRSLSKDFSKAIRRKIGSRLKSLFAGRRR